MADQPRLNRPESGSYGEKADLARLRQSLPPMQAQPPNVPGPTPAGRGTTEGPPPQIPGRRPGRPAGPQPPPGLPTPLAAPGDGTTPPQMVNPVDTMQAMPSDQRTLMLLDMLATSPDVSPDTREWAGTVLAILMDSSTAGV